MDIFDEHKRGLIEKNAPLADRMRPLTLDEFVGQDHIIGPGRLLRRAIQIDQLSSLIFYGPPGTGKTTLARIIANTTKAQFLSINAVLAGVKDIREGIKNAQDKLALYSKRTILFIDEVHRFNKAQQDALLPHVENGIIILIGATTENPYFEVNKALVSRSRIFQLRKLTENDLVTVAKQALSNSDRGYGNIKTKISNDALEHLTKVANGDARAVLNALELAVETTEPEKGVVTISCEVIEDSIQQRAVLYDKDGDAHYDTISAFIKSVRGSDPDAALYWMAKMLYAGEDPRFIFRRMIILASEDVGLADPNALPLVVAASQAFDYIGLPEGRFPMAQACLYLATAPKSNSTLAFFDAINAVSQEKEDEVPNHLKDSSRDKEGFGHGEGYLYPHAYRDHWTAQQYLPNILQGKTFYNPTDQGYEQRIKLEVTRRREAQIEAMVEEGESDIYGAGARQSRPSQKVWEGRTSGTSGEQLALIRNRLLDMVHLDKDNLVLDLHAKTGFITFEALRRVPEGSVWALAHSDRDYETMKTLAQRFPPLKQPQIILTGVTTSVEDIKREAGKDVVFDVIIGRNILGQHSDKHSFVTDISSCLDDTGTLALAETVHSVSSRIADFIKFRKAADKNTFIKAEELLFSDPRNYMVNWTTASIKEEFDTSDQFTMEVREETFSSVRRISGSDVEFWLRETATDERNSLGDYLREVFTAGGFEEISKLLHGQLDNAEVTWRSAVAFFIFKKKFGNAI